MDGSSPFLSDKCRACREREYLIEEYKVKVHAAEAEEMDHGYDGNRPLFPFSTRPTIPINCDHCLYLQEQFHQVFDLFLWLTERKADRVRREEEAAMVQWQKEQRNLQYAHYGLPPSSSSSSSSGGRACSDEGSSGSGLRYSSSSSSMVLSSPDPTPITDVPINIPPSPVLSVHHPSSTSSHSSVDTNFDPDLVVSSTSSSMLTDSSVSVPDMSQVWPETESGPSDPPSFLNKAFIKYPNSVEDPSQSSGSSDQQ